MSICWAGNHPSDLATLDGMSLWRMMVERRKKRDTAETERAEEMCDGEGEKDGGGQRKRKKRDRERKTKRETESLKSTGNDLWLPLHQKPF